MVNTGNSAGLCLRRGISLLLSICLLLSMASEAFAASVGTTSSAVVDSSTMSFVKLSKAVNIFKEETTPTTGYVTVASGTWLMLASTSTYTVAVVTDATTTPVTTVSTEFGCLYYNSERYNVLWSDISADVQTDALALTYITGTLWTTSDYPSLRPENNLKRDIRVYGLQLALRTLGYYSGTQDGSYGDLTIAAVRAFQKAYKLDVDGYAGPYTQKVLYPLAIAAYSSSGTTTGSLTGTVTTSVSINLRKSYSTKSARLAVVPKKKTLTYTKTVTTGGVKWYYVVYNSLSGWLMGTYLSADGSSTGTTESNLGTVTATTNAVVRKTANGSRTGYLLSKGSTATLLAAPTTAGGYSWYYAKLSNGVKGYIRGDCIDVTYDAGGGLTPSTTKTYVQVTADAGIKIFTSEEESTTGEVTIQKGSILQMVSTDTYTVNSKVYGSVYYDNTRYNTLYSNLSGIMLTTAQVTDYITGTLWPAAYAAHGTLKEVLNLKGSLAVHSLQYALTILGYYSGALDGVFGTTTTAAVRNFQKAVKTTVDGSVGPETSAILYPMAVAALTGVNTGDFGTITSIEKASWTFGDDGGSLFPRSAVATVMDVETQMVFKVRRWSGSYHADCVPYSAADTKTMCDIVGFAYNSSHPSTSQKSDISGDSKNNNTTYTWPNFGGAWGGTKLTGNKWGRRPALLNVGGRVFCVSIYGWPHGYGSYDTCDTYAAGNNYYGMMCIHFAGSYTHINGNVDSDHQDSINTAYAKAKLWWPALVK